MKRARRTVSNRGKARLTTGVFHRISAIPQKEWDAVYPDALEGYCFFKALDESGLDQFQFFYITVRERGRIVGAAPCFYMDYPLETTVDGKLKALIVKVRKVLPRLCSLRAVVAGNPTGPLRIGVADDREDVFAAITRRMERIAHKKRASIVAFKDLDKNALRLGRTIERHGFFCYESLPSTELDIRFDTFEEYLMTLGATSREGIRRKFKKVDGKIDIGLDITRRLSDDELGRVYNLYLQTVERSQTQFEVLPERFFKVISDTMHNEVRYFLWRSKGVIVAFALCLVSRDRFVDFYLGFDYSISLDYNLYYIRIRDLIAWCIAHGITLFDMGYTGYEGKRRLGFRMVPQYLLVKHRNPVLNPLFKMLCELLKPKNYYDVIKDRDTADTKGKNEKKPAYV
ncbi:MAG: GNAT family N-acetyltransferase [Candidatus Omnitrophica bacterium]|nr:GNAT family N-acetyltransferase [Candidatus Omnitrophota bacterium]